MGFLALGGRRPEAPLSLPKGPPKGEDWGEGDGLGATPPVVLRQALAGWVRGVPSLLLFIFPLLPGGGLRGRGGSIKQGDTP